MKWEDIFFAMALSHIIGTILILITLRALTQCIIKLNGKKLPLGFHNLEDKEDLKNDNDIFIKKYIK